MSMENMEPTQPIQPAGVDAEATQEIRTNRPRQWLWIVLGILIVIGLGLLGGALGYNAAIRQRVQAEASQVALKATEQFQLGILDQEAGRYEMARQRFEHVIRLDPTFPGAAERLAEVMVLAGQVSTPTPAPTPTEKATPTPDLRGEEELFLTAKQYLAEKMWEEAIQTLDALRATNLEYKAIQVDGMYYVALRNRGVDKILLKGELESGMYDLALTELFGPLDAQADSYRTWARYYIIGASFWKIDWAQVVYYFGQIYPNFPNLRDAATNLTARERFRLGSIGYGDQLMAAGDYCGASEQYRNAMELGDDPLAAPTATAADFYCRNTPTPKGWNPTETPTMTETPTPTSEIFELPTDTQPSPPTETPPAPPPTDTPSP